MNLLDCESCTCFVLVLVVTVVTFFFVGIVFLGVGFEVPTYLADPVSLTDKLKSVSGDTREFLLSVACCVAFVTFKEIERT